LKLLKSCQEICLNTNLELTLNPPSEAVTNTLVAGISDNIEKTFQKLDASQEMKFNALAELQEKRFQDIQAQIEQMKSYTDSLNAIRNHSNDCKPTGYVTGQHNSSSAHMQHTPDTSIEELNILHAYNVYEPNFITTDLADELYKMFNECDQFKENKENGHSVMTYGHPYHYVGSKSSPKGPVKDLQGPLLKIVKKLQEEFPECGDINSCLVNKYCGAEASLPNHADDEFCIDPTSSIFTVSIGSKATVRFTNQHDERTEELDVHPNSVYVMSRASQQLWKHQIREGTLQESEVRYSLTFRMVSERFLRSTVILGDSNTAKLKFGVGKGTFGQLIPGQRVKTIFIEDINPLSCCGYKNIIIHCGINSIKHYRVKNREMVEEHFDDLKSKLEQIMILCPKSNLIVAPILPTKTIAWNARAQHFNKCLFDFENLCKGKFSTLNYSVFVDPHTGFLRSDLGCYWYPGDPLHLGASGIRSLIGLIRERVLSNKITSNRKFSAVLSGNSAHTLGTDHDATLAIPSGGAAS